jgi:hypothetical protein
MRNPAARHFVSFSVTDQQRHRISMQKVCSAGRLRRNHSLHRVRHDAVLSNFNTVGYICIFSTAQNTTELKFIVAKHEKIRINLSATHSSTWDYTLLRVAATYVPCEIAAGKLITEATAVHKRRSSHSGLLNLNYSNRHVYCIVPMQTTRLHIIATPLVSAWSWPSRSQRLCRHSQHVYDWLIVSPRQGASPNIQQRCVPNKDGQRTYVTLWRVRVTFIPSPLLWQPDTVLLEGRASMAILCLWQQ